MVRISTSMTAISWSSVGQARARVSAQRSLNDSPKIYLKSRNEKRSTQYLSHTRSVTLRSFSPCTSQSTLILSITTSNSHTHCFSMFFYFLFYLLLILFSFFVLNISISFFFFKLFFICFFFFCVSNLIIEWISIWHICRWYPTTRVQFQSDESIPSFTSFFFCCFSILFYFIVAVFFYQLASWLELYLKSDQVTLKIKSYITLVNHW